MNALATLEKKLSWAEKVAFLASCFQCMDDQKTCPVKHSFIPGWYVREMTIPANTVFIGRTHRHGHRCVLISGRVALIDENRGTTTHEAPFEITTAPGYQMVLQTLTEVVGQTYHPNPTESRDIEALEAEAFHPAEEVFTLGRDVERRVQEALT
jgi:hypothetical protein